MPSKELNVYIRAREALNRMSEVQHTKESNAASRIQKWYRRQGGGIQAASTLGDSRSLALPNCENDPRQQLLKVFWRCCEQDETRASKRQLARVCGSLRDVANTFRMPLQIPVTPYVGTRDELEVIMGARDASADPTISWNEFNALVTSRAYTAVIHDGMEIPCMEDTRMVMRRLFEDCAPSTGGPASRVKLVKACVTVPEILRIMGVAPDVPETPVEGLRDMFETILNSVCSDNSPGHKITWDEFWNCYVGFSKERLWQPIGETGWRTLQKQDEPTFKYGPSKTDVEDQQQLQQQWDAQQQQRQQKQQPQHQRAFDAVFSAPGQSKRTLPGGGATEDPGRAGLSTAPTTASSTAWQEAPEMRAREADGACDVEAVTPEFKEAMNAIISDGESFWHSQARAFAESTLFNALRASQAVVAEEKRISELHEQERLDAERRVDHSLAEYEASEGSDDEEDYMGVGPSKLTIFGKLPREEEANKRRAPECPKCFNIFLSDANFCRVCGTERPVAGPIEEKPEEKVPDISHMRFGGHLPNSLPLAKLQTMAFKNGGGGMENDSGDVGVMSDSSDFTEEPAPARRLQRHSTKHSGHSSMASSSADAGLAHLLEGLNIKGKNSGRSFFSAQSSKARSHRAASTAGVSDSDWSNHRLEAPLPRIGPQEDAVEQVKINVHSRGRDFAAYRALIDEALQTIAKIKSALYNADRSGAGAEFLVQDAKMMLNMLLRGVVNEAAKGQKIVEAHFQLTPEATACLKENAVHLEALVNQHLHVLRDEHVAETSKLESLRDQVAKAQAEMNSHGLSLKKAAANAATLEAAASSGATGSTAPAAGPASSSPAAASIGGSAAVGPPAAAGFSLEDARGVLRAFATVLRPRLMALAALDPQQRTCAESVALKFLSACAGEAAPEAGEVGASSPRRGPQLAAAQAQEGPGTPSWGFRTPLPEQQQQQQAQLAPRHQGLAGANGPRLLSLGATSEDGPENARDSLPSFGAPGAWHHGQPQHHAGESRGGRDFGRAKGLDMPPSFDPEEVVTPAERSTRDYIMQQTMIRVKHPRASLDFYTKVLGFRLITWRDYPEMGFSVYYLAHCSREEVPDTEEDRWDFCMSCPGCIALTWNHGTESEKGAVYNTGNNDATGSMDGNPVQGGFGHVGIAVPDVHIACQRFDSLGCEVVKKPGTGDLQGSAFIRDPDGYLVEILPQGMPVFKK